MSKEKSKTRKAKCAACSGDRNCDILGHHQVRGSDVHMSWEENWYILRCRGCDFTFVQKSTNNSEDYDHYHDEYGEDQIVHNETDTYWPALLKRIRPNWLEHFSVKEDESGSLADALKELYGALDNDLKTLSAIGVRMCFDIASELLSVDPNKTFAKKLDSLVDSGHIGSLDRDRIETLIDAGSASAHRGWQPTEEDIGVMLDVLEHFINAAFIAPQERKELDKRAAQVKARVPKRTRTAKAKNKQPPSSKAI